MSDATIASMSEARRVLAPLFPGKDIDIYCVKRGVFSVTIGSKRLPNLSVEPLTADALVDFAERHGPVTAVSA